MELIQALHYLESQGLHDLPYLSSSIDYFLAYSEQGIHSCRFYSSFPVESVDVIAKHTQIKPWKYVSQFVQSASITAICPVSGDLIRSRFSKHISTHHFYFWFGGAIEFALILGEFHGSPLGLCIPSKNIYISFTGKEISSDASRSWIESVLSSCDFCRAQRLMDDVKGEHHRLCILIGFMPNLGHYFWQDISGLSAVLQQRSHISDLAVPLEIHLPDKLSWLLPSDIFPELADCHVYRHKSFKSAMESANRLTNVAFRYPGFAVTSELRDCIYSAACLGLRYSRYVDIVNRCRVNNFLWVNVRGHNKRWRSQVQGIKSLISALHSIQPGLAIYFDGSPDSQPLINEIVDGLDAKIQYYNGCRVSLGESIVWAHHVRAYLSVVGSGLVINSWLACKPGVAHANKAHLDQAKIWQHVAPNAIPPYFIDKGSIADESDLYGDYDFDWNLAFNHLMQYF